VASFNQAGDLPHTAGRISRRFIKGIVAANRGRRGFTYTHHDLSKGENLPLLRFANRNGFRVNVSTESEAAADRAIAAGLPAVIAVPSTETRKTWHTPAGNAVLVCPAQRSDTKDVCKLPALREPGAPRGDRLCRPWHCQTQGRSGHRSR
jgi:hypothetical protein